MIEFSWHTFRERWQLFVGSILTVAVGVALVQASLQVMLASAEPSVPPGLTPYEAAQFRDRYDGATTLMGMAMLLSVFLTIFIVSSTFAFTVAQRRRDLALLRLVGGSRGQLRRLLLSEALLLGACGSVIGIPAGLLVLRLQIMLVIKLGFLQAEFSAPPVGWVMAAAGTAGVVISLLGVLAASRRAAKVRPLEALRDVGAARRVMTPGRWFFGLLLTACAIGLSLIAQTVGPVVALVTSTGFTMAGAIALSLLSPLVVPMTGRLFGLVLRGSNLGRLAEANLREGARRSASTAAPLIVLVSLLLGLSGTLGSMAKAAAEEQRTTVVGSLIVRSTGADAKRISSVPGVEVASPQASVPMILTMMVVNADNGRPREKSYHSGIVAVDPAAYRRTHRTSLQAGTLSDLSGRTLVATARSEDRIDLGGTATADLGGKTMTLRLVAVMPEKLSTTEAFLVPLASLPDHLIAGAPTETVVQVSDGMDPATVADAIRTVGIGEVSTVAEWITTQSAASKDNNVRTMMVLMGLSGLYAALAVINAVVMSCASRRREFATARVTGLTRAQVVRMAVIESWAVTVIGLFLGGLVVAGTLAGISAGIEAALGAPVVEVPWTLAGIIVIGAFTVIGLTSLLTTLSATRPRPVTLVAARE
jgi:putative ABC transport system permease protein